MSLKIHLLGVPRLEINNEIVEVDTRKAVAILAYMALAEERPSRDFLATFLWPEYDQSRARAALRRTLSAMRRDLGKEFFDITREAISFSAKANCWVDVQAFQEKVGADNATAWESAVGLYRDEFMAGFTLRDSPGFDEWQYFQSEQLRRTLSGILEKLIGEYRTQGEWANAIRHAQHWLALDPLREEVHRLLMSLLAWSGERTKALRQYRECVRILDEELGVAPLPETTDLYHAIQENQLAPPITPPPDSLSQVAEATLQVEYKRPSPSQIPLVGRENTINTLTESYAATGQPGGRFVILTGEAGIGKSRLAEEFLAAQRTKGVQIVMARCYEGEQGLAYGPVVAALRQAIALHEAVNIPEHWQQEIGRLLPDQLLPDQAGLPSFDGPGAQTRFFAAICQAFAALLESEYPGLLYVDDLQWADQATVDLLMYFVRRLPELKVFILGCWRTPDAVQETALRQLAATGQRSGSGRCLELTRLNQEDIQEMLYRLEKPAELAAPLFKKSEGLPFFLNYYLTQSDAGENWPYSFRDLLYTRLAMVDQAGQQLLQTAAVIGRSFDYDTLRNASGRSDEETVEALEMLLAHGLVTESTAGMTAGTTAGTDYDFSHQALRDLVYEETSFARRRLLHRRVAESLSQHRGRTADATAAQIAHHFQAAGQEATAADYFYEAGNYARQLFANTEALNHFLSALALGHPAAAELQEAIGDLQKLAGAYGAALAAYEKAAALVGTADLPRLEQKLGGVYHRQGDWERAVHHFSAALAALKGRDGQNRARILADWSRTAHRAGDTTKAQTLAEEALTLAETAGDLPALAESHNILGMLARTRGDYTAAAQHLQHSLELAPQLGSPGAQIAALNNLALLARDQADYAQAESLLTKALSLCRKLGDRHWEAALLNNLADHYHSAGNETAARSHVRQSVTILAEIGTDTAEWQPEIWKLTEW